MKNRSGGWMLMGTVAAGCLFAGCASSAHSQGGGYYLDDGPGKPDPQRVARLMAEPDPEPRQEPLLARANRPYRVMGQDFSPMTERKPYRKQGVASWYGQRFHGRPTSTGETYDMYRMTAAHPTLPLPSYARVTRLDNGRSVVVRVNDRGPFLRGRLIDLSYLAASKLGYVGQGHAKVEVELLDPATGQGMTPRATAAAPAAAPMAAPATGGAMPGAVAAGARVTPDPAQAGGNAAVAGKGRTSMARAGDKAVPVHDRTLPAVSLARAEVDLPGDEGVEASAQTRQGGSNAAPTGAASEGAVVASAAAMSQERQVSGDVSQGLHPSQGQRPDPAEALPVSTAASASTAPPARRAAEGDSGWFLQLGVFRQLDNALRVQREQMARSTPSDPPVELVQRGDHYRVLQGPYAEEADARAVAADIGERTGHKPGVSRQ